MYTLSLLSAAAPLSLSLSFSLSHSLSHSLSLILSHSLSHSLSLSLSREDFATTLRNRVLGTWKHIQGAESKEEILRKVQAHLDSIESVASEARKIHKCVKEDLQKGMSLMKCMKNAKEASSKFTSSFALMLLNSAQSSQSANVAVQATSLEGTRKERLRSSDVTIKRRRANKAVTMQLQHQRMEGANSNILLLPPLTPEANSNAEG